MDYRPEKLLGPQETAEKLNIAVATFYRMKARLGELKVRGTDSERFAE